MTTFTAITCVDRNDRAQALGAAVELLHPAPTGVGVMEVEDGSGFWEVGAYFTEKPDSVALDLLAAVHGAAPFAVSKLDDRDWVAQVRRELSPVAAGRFVVYGGHDAHQVPSNRIGLRIEAAMAFGTGHHGTTQGCLILLDRLARAGRQGTRVADIGCGTGVLAMAAAKLWRCRAWAGDIDPVAVATARANVAANGLAPWIGVHCGPGLTQPELRAGAPFDLIFANILAAPLKRLAPAIARHLAPGGVAVLSGLLTPQSKAVEAVYRGHGMVRADRETLGEWTSLALRRHDKLR